MSDPVSALGGASFDGFASIREIGPVGMISLRCKHDVKTLPKAIKTAVGVAMPGVRRIVQDGAFAAAWMAPDEVLLILPYAQVQNTLTNVAKALKSEHHLAVDVSDARAVFRIEGPDAGDVLMKLTPADVARLAPGEVRRSRVAQVAAAFWMQGDGYTLVCFRSVAGYVMGLLEHSAHPASALGLR
jgi:sarcosine oxidase, subunit gamma